MFFQAWRKRAQPGCSSAEASNDCMPETSETICHNNTEKCHTIIKGGRSACAAAFCRADAVTVAPLTLAMDSWVCMGMGMGSVLNSGAHALPPLDVRQFFDSISSNPLDDEPRML